MANYQGVIIEESLADKSVLKNLRIIEHRVEPVTENHKTPWVDKWTLDTVEIEETKADGIAEQISKSLDIPHKSSWYADYKNKDWHYIIFPNKIFKINRKDTGQYEAAKQHGISLGIPEHQVDFAPDDKIWERQA